MTMNQCRFLSKVVLVLYCLLNFCLVLPSVFADCGTTESDVEWWENELEAATDALAALEAEGYLPSVTIYSYAGAIGTGVGGAITAGPPGAVAGFITGGIGGAIGGGLAHYNKLKSARDRVATAERKLAEKQQELAECNSQSEKYYYECPHCGTNVETDSYDFFMQISGNPDTCITNP